MSTKGLNDFVWYDLQTPDPKAAIGFYSKLFGWTPQGEPDSGHVGWNNGENHFGGIGTPQAGVPAHWLGYVETDALEGTVERAKKMGAKVFAGPMSIGEGGDIAVVADPQGAAIGLYQGGKGHEGWEPRKTEPGDVGWAELGTSDIDGARAFYGECFGWKTGQSMQMPDGVYHMVMKGETSIAGLYTKPADMPVSAWTFYINVNDVDETVAKAKALGGKLLVGPQTVPDMVTFAILTDPQGATFGIAKSLGG
ncbi:MAG: VOC family protein [Myxococcales bacterium]|nr:VOC family protein [Myxococcales bacterium]